MPALYGIRVKGPTGWQDDDIVAVCGICIGEGWRLHTKFELESHSGEKMPPWELDALWKTSQELHKKFFPDLTETVLKQAAAKRMSEGI